MNQNTLSEGPADGDESSRNSDQQTNNAQQKSQEKFSLFPSRVWFQFVK